VLLQLKVLGVQSPAHFPFLSPPTEISMRKAFELLLRLKALDEVRNKLLCLICSVAFVAFHAFVHTLTIWTDVSYAFFIRVKPSQHMDSG